MRAGCNVLAHMHSHARPVGRARKEGWRQRRSRSSVHVGHVNVGAGDVMAQRSWTRRTRSAPATHASLPAQTLASPLALFSRVPRLLPAAALIPLLIQPLALATQQAMLALPTCLLSYKTQISSSLSPFTLSIFRSCLLAHILAPRLPLAPRHPSFSLRLSWFLAPIAPHASSAPPLLVRTA